MLSLPNSDGQRDHIQLCDKLVESSPVVRILVDIVYTSEVNCDEFVILNLVLDLADKWEFDQIPKVIRRELQSHVLEPGYRHIDGFNLAVRMQDAKIAASWIKMNPDYAWCSSTPSASSLGDSAEGARPLYMKANPGLMDFVEVEDSNIFNVGGWGYDLFTKVPPDLTWALLRVTHHGTARAAVIDYDEVAKEFERIFTLACKLEFSCSISVSQLIWQTSRNHNAEKGEVRAGVGRG